MIALTCHACSIKTKFTQLQQNRQASTLYISCGNHNSIVSHIQGIIRCRVVVHCIDMDVSFYKKKVHMSEKHTKLKVLTKIIIYPESLNAVVSICPLTFLLEVYFPQKKNFNNGQSFSTTFFHVQNCLKIVLCHDLCTNIL